MDERGLTYRSLADITRELNGKGMTHGHLNQLAAGREKPSLRAMELLAQACDVPPEHFAEYRLAAAMRELDPEVVGLEQALANLSARMSRKKSAAQRLRPRRQAG